MLQSFRYAYRDYIYVQYDLNEIDADIQTYLDMRQIKDLDEYMPSQTIPLEGVARGSRKAGDPQLRLLERFDNARFIEHTIQDALDKLPEELQDAFQQYYIERKSENKVRKAFDNPFILEDLMVEIACYCYEDENIKNEYQSIKKQWLEVFNKLKELQENDFISNIKKYPMIFDVDEFLQLKNHTGGYYCKKQIYLLGLLYLNEDICYEDFKRFAVTLKGGMKLFNKINKTNVRSAL